MARSDSRRGQDRLTALLNRHPWISRLAEVRFRRNTLTFGLSSDLFSSASVDVGTLRLLRLLTHDESPLANSASPLSILDVGCGAGTIGLAIAAAVPDCHVTLIDRDRLAVAISRWNAKQNGLGATTPKGETPKRAARVEVLDAGLDYQPCHAAKAGPFDLIVTNIPAKVGWRGLDRILFGAGDLLRPGGVLAVVHVVPLGDAIDEMMAERIEQGVEIEVLRESIGKEHVARMWRFPQGLPPVQATDALTPYRRDDAPSRVLLRNMPVLTHQAVHDVTEFDSPNYRTPLLIDVLQLARPIDEVETPERILVIQPAHGFLAAMVAFRREPRELALLSRDSLELQVATLNLDDFLRRQELDSVDRIEPPKKRDHEWLPAPAEEAPPYDVILGPLNMREGKEGVRAGLSALRDAMHEDGTSLLIVAVQAGQIESLRRAAHDAGLRVGRTKSRRGFTAVVLRRRRHADSTHPEEEDDDFDLAETVFNVEIEHEDDFYDDLSEQEPYDGGDDPSDETPGA